MKDKNLTKTELKGHISDEVFNSINFDWIIEEVKDTIHRQGIKFDLEDLKDLVSRLNIKITYPRG